MSVRSLNKNMSINQKTNRVVIDKFVGKMGMKANKADYSHLQEKLQEETNKHNIVPFNPEIYNTIK